MAVGRSGNVGRAGRRRVGAAVENVHRSDHIKQADNTVHDEDSGRSGCSPVQDHQIANGITGPDVGAGIHGHRCNGGGAGAAVIKRKGSIQKQRIDKTSLVNSPGLSGSIRPVVPRRGRGLALRRH